jgi:hypothetical protein
MTLNRDADFCLTLIKKVLSDDPSKIAMAIEDYDYMVKVGATFEGDTREEVMAEYVVHMMKTMNPHIPELVDALNQHYDEIEKGLIALFISEGY